MPTYVVNPPVTPLRWTPTGRGKRVVQSSPSVSESGEELEALAEALYLEREYAAAAAHYERAYTAYRNQTATRWPRAGRRARQRGSPATSSGTGRCRTAGSLGPARILEEAGEDRPERGWVLIIRSFSEPDPQVREATLRDAIAVGRRFGDPDIEFEALGYLGGLFVMTDRIEEGLVLLDEALAAACAGEMTEVTTVDGLFCGFFWACELVNDVPRADQWMRAAADLMNRRNVVAAFCRAHYGGILTAAGRWEEAEIGAPRGRQSFRAGRIDEARGRAHPPR